MYAFQVVLFLITFHLYESTILVGGLFNDSGAGGTYIQEFAFKHAIHMVNDRLKDSGIIFDHETRRFTSERNSLYAEKLVCELLSKGVAGIFGPQLGDAHYIVQAVCDTKEIPHIQTRWDPQQKVGSCSVNIHPYPFVFTKIFSAIVQAWDWKGYVVLYENSESLLRISSLLKHSYNNTIKVKVKRIVFDKADSYRGLLREVKDFEEHNIILDCSIEILPEILKQAQQVGLMGSDHSFLITNLDFQTLDLEPYQYGGTNITGLRLFDPDNIQMVINDLKEFVPTLQDPVAIHYNMEFIEHKFPVEAALIYDAVELYASAVQAMLDDESKRTIKPAPCDSEDAWGHGYSIINYMKLSSLRGLTGEIRFDPQGFRTYFTVEIIELTENGIKKVGKWNTVDGITIIREPLPPLAEKPNSLKNKTFNVLVALTAPYGLRKKSHKTLVGNDQYEGFCVDLINELSSMNDNFTINLMVDPEGKTGGLVKGSNPPQWIGMIGAIRNGTADLACADITINREREEAVDLTSPFMDLGIAILYKKPQSQSPGFFSFLSPFEPQVWILVVTAYISVSLMFFIMARISPYEWRNPYPCVQDPDELENQFTLNNSFWFTIGALMQQGSEIAPVSVSTRMAAGVWWFFTLIMVACYTANLAAFLTTENPSEDFSNIDDLAQQNEIQYGAKADGTTYNFFNLSPKEIHKRMFNYMQAHADEVLTPTPEEGVRRAADPNRKYAFLMESSQIEYETERHCSLTQVGKPIDNKGYGIAMKKGSWYLGLFSQSILKMQEDGRLSDLKRKWWKEKYAGSCPKEQPEEAETLGLSNLGGVFIVLGGGVMIAIIIAVLEQLFYVWSISKEEDISMKERLKWELKFFFKCRGTTKPATNEEGSNNSGEIDDS